MGSCRFGDRTTKISDVHLFGAASSPGCANFSLKYLAQQHKSEYPSAFIEKNFYVDDDLTSVSSIKEAKDLIEAQKLCKRGGLHLILNE